MSSISQQARGMARALNEASADWGALLERAWTGAKAGETTPLHDTARSEAFFLSIHLLDRIALRNLGFADRELYMNALLSALSATMLVPELRAGYNAVQMRYGNIRKLLPEKDESPKDTLFWEVAKVLGAEHAAMNPVAITLSLQVVSDMYIGLAEAFNALNK